MNNERPATHSATMAGSRLFDIYSAGKYLSIKHSSYFHVYERLFERYVGTDVTFVEVGVLNGGSLFMWREFFGPRARIIGVDLNPAAKKWESEGFEIKIGNQADATFWSKLFAEIGPIDILLDDGGHTNKQQIVTTCQALDNVKDGGLVAIEDTHCSYFTEFGNPCKFSFISFAKRMVDHIHTRNPKVAPLKHLFSETVASVRFFESIVAFEVDRRLCAASKPTSNNGVSADALDFRYEGSVAAQINALGKNLAFLSGIPLLWRASRLAPFLLRVNARIESHRLRQLFK